MEKFRVPEGMISAFIFNDLRAGSQSFAVFGIFVKEALDTILREKGRFPPRKRPI